MRIGQLRNRVTIERATETVGSAGGRTKTWAKLTDIWANVMPLQGTESVKGSQNKSVRQLSVLIRYNAEVQATDRVILPGGETLQILWTDNVSWPQEWTKLVCSETVGEAR